MKTKDFVLTFEKGMKLSSSNGSKSTSPSRNAMLNAPCGSDSELGGIMRGRSTVPFLFAVGFRLPVLDKSDTLTETSRSPLSVVLVSMVKRFSPGLSKTLNRLDIEGTLRKERKSKQK